MHLDPQVDCLTLESFELMVVVVVRMGLKMRAEQVDLVVRVRRVRRGQLKA